MCVLVTPFFCVFNGFSGCTYFCFDRRQVVKYIVGMFSFCFKLVVENDKFVTAHPTDGITTAHPGFEALADQP